MQMLKRYIGLHVKADDWYIKKVNNINNPKAKVMLNLLTPVIASSINGAVMGTISGFAVGGVWNVAYSTITGNISTLPIGFYVGFGAIAGLVASPVIARLFNNALNEK